MSDMLKRAEGIKERPVGEELMLYDVTGRTVHVLNETAAFVWQRCDGHNTVDDIVNAAVKEYSISEADARVDIEECIGALTACGALG